MFWDCQKLFEADCAEIPGGQQQNEMSRTPANSRSGAEDLNDPVNIADIIKQGLYEFCEADCHRMFMPRKYLAPDGVRRLIGQVHQRQKTGNHAKTTIKFLADLEHELWLPRHPVRLGPADGQHVAYLQISRRIGCANST